MDELRFIRQIWLDEKHEFDDSLPRIYEAYLGYREAEARIEEADRQLEEAARRKVLFASFSFKKRKDLSIRSRR